MDKSRVLELKIAPVGAIAADLRSNKTFIFFVVAGIILYVLVSAGLFSAVEGRSYFDSIYFTVINVTTVGFGDIKPTATPGKIISIANSVIGVVAFGFLVASITIALQPSEFAGSIQQRDDNGTEKTSMSDLDSFLHGLESLIDMAEPKLRVEEAIDSDTRERSGNLRVHVRHIEGTADDRRVDIWVDIHVRPLSR